MIRSAIDNASLTKGWPGSVREELERGSIHSNTGG